MSKTFKVAAAQLAPVFLDRDATTERACRAIAEAGREGARLVVFPESYLPGYPYFALVKPPTEINDAMERLYDQAVVIGDATTTALCDAARDAGCLVVMGLNEREGGTLYNGQLFIGADGSILGSRRKLIPTSHERLVWGRGDGADLALFDTELGRLGGLICYEHANALFRYALQGAGEQIHVAGWPGGIPIDRKIDAAVRHYAFEGMCYVISVTSLLTPDVIAAIGADDVLKPGGGQTAIVAPGGAYIAGPVESDAGLVYGEVDLTRIDRGKSIVDTAGHYARPDVVQLVRQSGRRRSIVDA